MISETVFATRAVSFWQALTPTSEAFIRQINSDLVKRQTSSIESKAQPSRRGLINETAFEAFVRAHEKNSLFPVFGQAKNAELVTTAYFAACKFLDRAEGNQIDVSPLTELEFAEVGALIDNLELSYWQPLKEGSLTFRPAFRGCGVISGCRGDLRTEDTLIEVKSGDRPFRSSDLRQALVYCALELQSSGRSFDRIELFNPRSGLVYNCKLQVLAFEIAGSSATELLFAIIDFISASGASN